MTVGLNNTKKADQKKEKKKKKELNQKKICYLSETKILKVTCSPECERKNIVLNR